MRIAIVDDEKHWIDKVKREIEQYKIAEITEIDTFESGEKFLESPNRYDISFIDIEMPRMDGFETISKARKKDEEGLFVILTTHTEMSRRGYYVNAFRYIDKMRLREIMEALDSAIIVLERNRKITVNVINDMERELVLKNILYFETEKHYVIVHTKHGNYKCSDNMQELETLLPEKWFCRCHNSFIVNLDEIVQMKERIIYLSNGDDIDIAHRRFHEVRKMYMNRQYECANG